MDENKKCSAEPKDGRKTRKEANKQKVIKNFLQLIEKNKSLPTAQKIAQEAGLSRRSIFRYFPNLDELIEEAYSYALKEIRERFPPPKKPDSANDLYNDIIKYVNHLSSIYEYTDSIRDALSEKGMPPEVRKRINRMRSQTLREELIGYFAVYLPELEEDTSFIFALESSLSPEAWDYLRKMGGLSKEEAQRAWVEMLARLLKK